MKLNTSDFEEILSSLEKTEIDKSIISNALSKHCNKSVEIIEKLISFKILRAITGNGDIVKGFINFEDITASVELEFLNNKYIMKSLTKIY